MKGFRRSTLMAGLGLCSLSGASATNREDVLLRTTLEQLSVADLLHMASMLSRDETVELGVEPFHHMSSKPLKYSKDSGASSDRPKIGSYRSYPSFCQWFGKWLKPGLVRTRVNYKWFNYREQVDNYIRALEREVEKLKSKLEQVERETNLLTEYDDNNEVLKVLRVVSHFVKIVLGPCFRDKIESRQKDDLARQITKLLQTFFQQYFNKEYSQQQDNSLILQYFSEHAESISSKIQSVIHAHSHLFREGVDLEKVSSSLVAPCLHCCNGELDYLKDDEALDEQGDVSRQISHIIKYGWSYRMRQSDKLAELQEDKKILQEQLSRTIKQYQQLFDKYNRLKKQYNAVKHNNESMYIDWRQNDIKIAQVYQEAASQGRDVPAVPNPSSSVINENAGLRMTVIMLREDNAILRGKIGKLTVEAESNQKEKEKITEEKKTMNQKLETLNSLNDQLQKDSDTLKGENERLKGDVKRSNSMVDELKNKIKDLQQSSEQETKKVHWLESRLRDEEDHRKDAQKRLAELLISKPI